MCEISLQRHREPLFMHSDEVKIELPVLVSSPLALILLRDSHSRKTETTEDLANALAKLVYIIDQIFL